MFEHVLPNRLNPDNRPLFTFEELDIGQAFMHGYSKHFNIKISRYMYFDLIDNHIGVITKELRTIKSRIYFKCDYEVW